MANDIAAKADGDLDLSQGMKLSSERIRDRNITIVRILTVKGELRFHQNIGVDADFIGGSLDNDSVSALKRQVRVSLAQDLGLRDLQPKIKVLPIRKDRVLVLVQPQKDYEDGEDPSAIVGDYWHRNEKMTKLDGSEG